MLGFMLSGNVSVGIKEGADLDDWDDQDITDAVETELLVTHGVPFDPIDVETTEGVVSLGGTVTSLLAKERATRAARSVKGVRAVVNVIEVEPIDREDHEIRKDVVDALLMNPATESYEIDVKVNGGAVNLAGDVESFQEKELAATVAKGVKGVRELENDIKIVFEGERSDSEVKAEIEQVLHWDVRVDDNLIDVSVEKGRVALTGTVGSAREKSRAEVDALMVAGVREVDASGLEVRFWARNENLRGAKYSDLSDERIADAVRDAFLMDPRVKSFNPDIDVEKGTVNLTGWVDNLSAKMAAEETARNVVGVWRVKNFLKVRPAVESDDDAIARKVREALSRDPYVDRYDIAVNVQHGDVNLYGTVDSLAEKRRAEEIVWRVRGVLTVDNYLKSEDAQASYYSKRDWELEQDIESQLFWSPFVDAGEVAVSVDDGVATLTGEVETWSERMAAQENAFQAGVKDVRNRILVEFGPVDAPRR
jgi:osmotically-inducible protein OsmY